MSFASRMHLPVLQHIPDRVGGLARRSEQVGVVAIGKHRPLPAHHLAERARDPGLQALHRPAQCFRVGPRRSSARGCPAPRSAPGGTRTSGSRARMRAGARGKAAMGAEVPDLATDADRDVQRALAKPAANPMRIQDERADIAERDSSEPLPHTHGSASNLLLFRPAHAAARRAVRELRRARLAHTLRAAGRDGLGRRTARRRMIGPAEQLLLRSARAGACQLAIAQLDGTLLACLLQGARCESLSGWSARWIGDRDQRRAEDAGGKGEGNRLPGDRGLHRVSSVRTDAGGDCRPGVRGGCPADVAS